MIVLQAATNWVGEGVREDIVLGLLIDTESRSSCCRPERVGRNRGTGVGHVHGGFGVLVQERYPPGFFSFFFPHFLFFLLLLLSFLFSSPSHFFPSLTFWLPHHQASLLFPFWFSPLFFFVLFLHSSFCFSPFFSFKLLFPCFKHHVLMLKTWNMDVWGTLCPPL